MTYSDSVQAKIDRFEKAVKEFDGYEPANGDWGHVDSRIEHQALAREVEEGRKTGYGPEVGMPCTMHIGADDYAMKLLRVSPSGHEVFAVHSDENETNVRGNKFTRRADGSYCQVGGRHCYLTFLKAEDYRDPSF